MIRPFSQKNVQYRFVTLNNKMNVILVSDDAYTNTGASMKIMAGSARKSKLIYNYNI